MSKLVSVFKKYNLDAIKTNHEKCCFSLIYAEMISGYLYVYS